MNSVSTNQSAPPQGGLEEKVRTLEEFVKASLNLLEDFNLEQVKFKEAQRANLNILEDFDHESLKLREIHRATLNILEDFNIEKKNAERATEQLRVTSVSRDELMKEVADRKQAEERFRRVVESAPSGMIMVGREGKITLVNSQTEKLFGYSREELLGQKIEMLVPERFRVEHPGHRDSFFSDPKARAMGAGRDLFGLKKDGTEIPVEIGLNPIETSEGLFTLASVVDITMRKRLEQEIFNRNRELETLLHVTSHDLKEPLRAIENFSEMITQQHMEGLDPEGKDLFVRVTRASQRLGRLLDDILTLTRARRIEKPAVAIDGQIVVNEALARLEERVQETGAKVKVVGKFPFIYADKTWVVEAVYNLLSNALKFRKDDCPPEIEIASYDPQKGDPPGIGFVVRDRGPGVAPEQAEMIFELFKRAVGREVEGTGAGLAIVREVARRRGGEAWVRPRDGGGSEFIITFGD